MMISFQKPKHGSLVFCLFGEVHPCGGEPRPAVFITARDRTRPKWCHHGVPSEPTKIDVSGGPQ